LRHFDICGKIEKLNYLVDLFVVLSIQIIKEIKCAMSANSTKIEIENTESFSGGDVDVPDSTNPYTTSFSCEQGLRRYQEDKFFIGGSVWGVFDGHGSSRVSTTVRDAFVMREPRTEADLRQAFDELAKVTNDEYTGTTAVVLGIDGNVASVGNLGDSPCLVIYKDNAIKRWSTDHTPDNEKERIQDEGFTVYNNRIRSGLGSIAVSRAFGDVTFPAVISEGSFDTFPLDDVVCIILCSDGVTDGLTDEEIRDVVLGAPIKSAANILVDAAMKSPGWKGDNTTAIVNWIDQIASVTVVTRDGEIVPTECWPEIATLLHHNPSIRKWKLVVDTGVMIECESGENTRRSELYFDLMTLLFPTQLDHAAKIAYTLGQIWDEDMTLIEYDYTDPELALSLDRAVSSGTLSASMAQQVQIWWHDEIDRRSTALL
jgi:serine/threonine protein phosphatase PrpC